MTDTTAKIRAKGLDSTGVTEDIASEMYRRKGAHYMAIVELKVEERHEKADGDKKVDLIITRVEPAVDETMAEHLRELSRVVYLNRAQYDGQATIDSSLDNERSVADVLAAGAMHRPHPFLPVDASNDNGICDVCGGLEAVPVHSTQDTLPDGDDESEEQERKPIEGVDRAGVPLDANQNGRIDSTEPSDEESADDWSYPAPEGITEPVEYDERPNATVIAQGQHIHVAGECIKNRHGAICTPAATIPDPFTAPA